MNKQPLPSVLTRGSRKNLLTFGLFASLLTTGCTSQKTPDVYQQIIQNIVQQETEGIDITPIDAQTKNYLELLNDEGAFTDIDYTSRAQTGWKPLEHVSRLKEMVVSYITPASNYYGDANLYTQLVKMFNYWYDANPTSTNWWFHEIGWAQRMGLSLSLMRAGNKQLPDTLENKLLERMKKISKGPDQKGSQGTGANKMDIALQWIYRTCLQKDQSNLEFAIDQFFYPIKFNSGQGIQSDYSYLQHGKQLYTGGYGASVLNAYLKVAFYLENTPYANPEKNELIGKFVRYGNIPAIRGKYMLYNALGRGIARENETDRSSLAPQLAKLMKLDSTNAEVYQACIRRMEGKEAANYGIQPFHRHFWRSDHTIHQRPTYTMDVRMASTRTARCENGNGENLQGYFLTEGGTGIVRRGDEYANIFPSWDWSHIPGTTTPAVEVIPKPGPWEHKGQSTFTGGVSNGIYGITTYQQTDKDFKVHTSAKKSWFFFDKEVVCMGSDIQSSNTHPIHTTVNQCLLNGKATVLIKGKPTATVQSQGKQSYQNVLCINHDSISYYFPESGNLTVSTENQSGSWKKLSKHLSDATVSQPVFKLWFNHGLRPSKATYTYYVVPNTASPEEAVQKIDDLLTVNRADIQAVYNRSLDNLGIIFHQKGNIRLANIEVSSTTPCAVMFTRVNSDTIQAYISDPSYTLESTQLTLKTPRMSQQRTIHCPFKTDEHDAGSTHTYEVTESTVTPK